MRKRLVATLLVLCMVLGMLPGTAWAAETGPGEDEKAGEVVNSPAPQNNSEGIPYAVTGGNIYFYSDVYYPRTREVTGCDRSVTSANIPDSIDGVDVTSIGDGAFWGCGELANVTIPNSITTIGEEAFYECSGLKNITIPDSITDIGMRAFSGCSGLTNVTIPSGAWIGWFAFSNCTSLKDVTIANGITVIGDWAFLGCTGLTNVSIPNSVRTIGDETFANCGSLINVSIPDSVTRICKGAFSHSGLTTVTIPGSVNTIDERAFEGCSNLTNVVICDGVAYIGDYAFRGCSNLSSVTIPASVTTFGGFSKGMFDDCSSLISAGPIGGGYNYEFGWTDKIPAYAFSGCRNLTSVTIPSSVTSIGAYAFFDCDSLKNVYYGGSKEQWIANQLGWGNKDINIHYNSTGPDQPDPPTPPVETESELAFVGSWDPGKKIIKPTPLALAGGYTVTDETVISGASSIGELVNHYVMVEKEKTAGSSSGLWPEIAGIRPVEARIGEVTSIEQAGGSDSYRFVIDGSAYTIPFDKLFKLIGPASLENVREYFLGRKALCIFDGGELIRLDYLKFAAGTVKDRGSGALMMPEVTLETEMTQDVRGMEQYHVYCADTVSSIPAAGSSVGCYRNMDGVLVKVDRRTYQTKVGTLGMYEDESHMAVIDGVPVRVNAEEWEWNKDTERKPNVGDYVGKKVFYLLANGEIVHMDSLEKIKCKLSVTYPGAGLVVNRATYQNGSFNNFDTTVGDQPKLATISYKPAYYPFLKPYDRAAVYAADESSQAITLESASWTAGSGFECRGPDVRNMTLNPGEKAERGFMITIQSGFVPPYASKTVDNTLRIEGKRTDGEAVSCVMNYPVEVVNKDYKPGDPDDPEKPDKELDKLAEKANEELDKINSAIALYPDVMNDLFGIHGPALTQLQKEILTAVILSDAPEKSFEDKISDKLFKKVFKNYKEDVSVTGYTVPLLYQIATPKYGLVTVRFDCKVSMYKFNGKRLSFWVDVYYTIVKQEKGAKPIPDTTGHLGAGVSVDDISTFAESAYAVAEAELQNAFNEAWGNDAEKVADLFFNETIKTILKIKKTSTKKLAWQLMTWPSKEWMAKKVEKGKSGPSAKLMNACPTDIFVYDKNGVLCGAIESGVITKNSDEFRMSVDGDVMRIEGLEDSYAVQYKATDEGSISVVVTEYMGYQMPLRQVMHYDVPLKRGDLLTQDIADTVHQSVADYAIFRANGSVIPVDKEQTLITLEPSDSATLGDLNGDGKVTMADVLRLARGAAGYVTLTEQEQQAGDVTGDGKITMADVIRIARYAAGYSPAV